MTGTFESFSPPQTGNQEWKSMWKKQLVLTGWLKHKWINGCVNWWTLLYSLPLSRWLSSVNRLHKGRAMFDEIQVEIYWMPPLWTKVVDSRTAKGDAPMHCSGFVELARAMREERRKLKFLFNKYTRTRARIVAMTTGCRCWWVTIELTQSSENLSPLLLMFSQRGHTSVNMRSKGVGPTSYCVPLWAESGRVKLCFE